MSEFPGRPEHPDFRLIAQAVQDLDAQADSGQPVQDILGRHIDPDSAVYMARQRAIRAMLQRAKVREGLLGVPWLDGFLAGMIVQHLKAQPAERQES